MDWLLLQVVGDNELICHSKPTVEKVGNLEPSLLHGIRYI